MLHRVCIVCIQSKTIMGYCYKIETEMCDIKAIYTCIQLVSVTRVS